MLEGRQLRSNEACDFYAQMTLYGTSDAIMCRAFPMTLQGIARGWYSRLPPSSIHSFNQLTTEFESNFLSSAQPKPTIVFLLGMRQKEEEHLGQYLSRFTDEVRAIPDAHPSLVIQTFMIRIRPSCLFWSLVERPPITVPEMLQRANQYVAAKTLVVEKSKDQKHLWGELSRGPPSGLSRRMDRGEQTVPRPPNVLLNSTRTEIFLQIQEKGLLKTPNPLRSRAEDRDHRCYYRFHYDYGHDTEECYNLKSQIKDLIHRGHLDQYIRKPSEPSLCPKGSVERHIDVIVGGPTVGGVSSLARKAYAHR
ncbi:hypothetical protein B296_00035218 [Ensete ventricosum]|uniref:Retrotransposon gag domain-containing protein n=1 Tax=Ensete ventricosum TaxID=4639 RepID=A0A426Z701_ENSVE|nr:hypothetical protein B296_00035218 [Ensete ventricosum]